MLSHKLLSLNKMAIETNSIRKQVDPNHVLFEIYPRLSEKRGKMVIGFKNLSKAFLIWFL